MSFLRAITKPLRDAMESRERLRDLPVLMLQTALNGVGQALLIGDKVRSRIVRLVVGEEERSEKTEAPDAATRDEETPAEPAARREPVIFAPRPSKAERDGEQTAASAPAPAATPTATPTATPAPAPAETEAVPAPEAKVQESLGTPKPETAPETVAPETTPAAEAPATETTVETAQVTEAPQAAEVTEAATEAPAA
ncbi:hypothetical protein GSF24_15715, partial [Microbispora triticiradicis]|nr:hypothetical protein [Microbispora triticiradicis]